MRKGRHKSLRGLAESLEDQGLIFVRCMTMELGYATEQKKVRTLSRCEDWLRANPSRNFIEVSIKVDGKEVKNHFWHPSRQL